MPVFYVGPEMEINRLCAKSFCKDLVAYFQSLGFCVQIGLTRYRCAVHR